MNNAESIKVLASLHDRGLLVPFMGSGMSMGPCVGWDALVRNLEKATGTKASDAKGELIARAETVMQVLRQGKFDVPKEIQQALYEPRRRNDPTYSEILARMRWPLVCTTNYDDVYLRAAVRESSTARRDRVPRVRGRGEDGCRSVLQHLALPAGELVWCLQGFLSPEPYSSLPQKRKPTLQVTDCLEPGGPNLALEIVLGHSEYRRVTHRMPQFRRCFAEVYRSRSFLFLGSGLTETYFRTLFDEVIELVGPSSRPHFAFIRKGSLDADFMRTHYQTILIEYEGDKDGGHSEVGNLLQQLEIAIKSKRVRAQAWGWKVPPSPNTSAAPETPQDVEPDFTVVRASLPVRGSVLRETDILGVSCGRRRRKTGSDEPTPGGRTKERLSAAFARPVTWHSDYLVSWEGSERWLRGVVAREPDETNSRDARSPQAVYEAFERFLDDAQRSGKTRAFVQLLSAGHLKTFESWMSLVQMARAYGRWAQVRIAKGKPTLQVVVYLYRVDEVVMLMNGGYLDIAEHLEDAPIRLFVETIDGAGHVQRQHWMGRAGTALRDMSPFLRLSAHPAIHVLPVPGRGIDPVPFETVADEAISNLGLVSGSTLVVDYRAASVAAARAREKARSSAAAQVDD